MNASPTKVLLLTQLVKQTWTSRAALLVRRNTIIGSDASYLAPPAGGTHEIELALNSELASRLSECRLCQPVLPVLQATTST